MGLYVNVKSGSGVKKVVCKNYDTYSLDIRAVTIIPARLMVPILLPHVSNFHVMSSGILNREKRSLLWLEKRVFFLTPQVLDNDLSRGTCPAKLIRCLVLDEAHRAQGNHSYCQVRGGCCLVDIVQTNLSVSLF